MHKMSKESAANFAAIQSRLAQAEVILKLLLNDNINKEYVRALTTTYFSPIKNMEVKDEKKI